EDLGVSTGPVREKLLELARNGLIEPVCNRGFRGLEPTLAELREVRELLEVRATELLACRAPTKLDGLGRLADDIRAAVKADECMAIWRPTGASTMPSRPLRQTRGDRNGSGGTRQDAALRHLVSGGAGAPGGLGGGTHNRLIDLRWPVT